MCEASQKAACTTMECCANEGDDIVHGDGSITQGKCSDSCAAIMFCVKEADHDDKHDQ